MVKVKAEKEKRMNANEASFNHPMVKVKGQDAYLPSAPCICFNHPMVKVKVIIKNCL